VRLGEHRRELRAALEARAEEDNTTASEIIRRALRSYVA